MSWGGTPDKIPRKRAGGPGAGGRWKHGRDGAEVTARVGDGHAGLCAGG